MCSNVIGHLTKMINKMELDDHSIPWASYQIRKIAGCACAGNAGNVSPRRRFQRKPLVSDPGMHHGTCVTHVPWCMSGSLTCGDGKNVPSIPGACALAILRIWQEAHNRSDSTPPSRRIYVYWVINEIEEMERLVYSYTSKKKSQDCVYIKWEYWGTM